MNSGLRICTVQITDNLNGTRVCKSKKHEQHQTSRVYACKINTPHMHTYPYKVSATKRSAYCYSAIPLFHIPPFPDSRLSYIQCCISHLVSCCMRRSKATTCVIHHLSPFTNDGFAVMSNQCGHKFSVNSSKKHKQRSAYPAKYSYIYLHRDQVLLVFINSEDTMSTSQASEELSHVPT